MHRRKFIQLSGIGMAGMPIVNPLKKKTRQLKRLSITADVIVVGAGTFGVWTAYHLQQMGANVTLLDAYGPGNSRASSGGETRLIQVDTDNSVYVRSAINAYGWWKKLEEASGETIVLSTGRLAMSTSESYRQYATSRDQKLRNHGINNTEVLNQDEIRYRWPQIFTNDLAAAMYNQSGPAGSTLMARQGVRAVADQFVKSGGTIKITKGIPIMGSDGRVQGIDVNDKNKLLAQYYVFACGPWLPKLFPDLLDTRLNVERRDVLFVGTPPGDTSFSYPNLPEWSVEGSGYYGFPGIEGRGVKVAPYPDNNSFDPDSDERLINQYQVRRAHDFVKHRFPALGSQPIIESRVCQVTNSIDKNFVVDRHPSSDNCWIVGGGSGHGFKHGPSIGEFAANRVLGEPTDPELDQIFKIKDGIFTR